MRRLYHKVYLTIVASIVVVLLAAGALWRIASNGPPARHAFEMAGELASFAVPPPDAPRSEVEDAVRRLSQRLHVDLGLYDGEKRLIANAGRPVPRPSDNRDEGGWIYGQGGPAWAIALPDGRWLVARTPRAPRRPALGILGFLAAMALLVALIAMPVARGLTRRLERLQAGVEKLGKGDLAARVAVEGNDEVARLAASFNSAAGRIEELVAAHKMLLANASHEIRTPLARIRMGLDLMKGDATPERRAGLVADIAELDALVDEILLASRLEAVGGLDARESVDLLALAAEEAARYDGIDVSGSPVLVEGDPKLLRRLVRNLLENARRHGKPPIALRVTGEGAIAVLTVADAGPGVPAAERDRVFEPFRRSSSSATSGGTGLGLALVRQIARKHGGDATVVPTATGTAFRVAVAARHEDGRIQ